MTKRKFAQVGLDAIDASLVEATIYYEYFGKGGEHYHPLEVRQWKRTIRELRAIRRMIVATGKARTAGIGTIKRPDANCYFVDHESASNLAKEIHRVREIERRRKA
jgi:hypothetical protein